MPNNMDITVHNLHKGHRETILPMEARSGDTYTKGEKGQKRTRELETNNTTKHTLQDNIIDIFLFFLLLPKLIGKEQKRVC